MLCKLDLIISNLHSVRVTQRTLLLKALGLCCRKTKAERGGGISCAVLRRITAKGSVSLSIFRRGRRRVFQKHQSFIRADFTNKQYKINRLFDRPLTLHERVTAWKLISSQNLESMTLFCLKILKRYEIKFKKDPVDGT